MYKRQDVGSQVIVNGQVRGNMQAMEYFHRKRDYIPAVLEAYNSLNSEYDVIVIEGAGSPAEINLKQDDIVNMGLAKLVDAPVLLVGDIEDVYKRQAGAGVHPLAGGPSGHHGAVSQHLTDRTAASRAAGGRLYR